MSDSIQFRGVENVMTAFESRGIDAWSLWYRKQMLNKGMGADELRTFLDLIGKSSTNAIYTLKVYEEIDNAKQIKSNTPDDGSINFRLNMDDQVITGSQYQRYTSFKELDERMDRIEKLLTEEEANEEEEEETIGSILKGLLQEPQKLGQLIEVAKNVFGLQGQSPAINNAQPPVRIAGVDPAINNQNSEEISEQKLLRLSKALDTLGMYDNQLTEHIEKLAQIATENPNKFKGLLTLLDVA